MLRCQVLCSPGGLCPALIACVCAHSSGRAEQRGFPGCAVLGKAVSIRDSLLLTERGRAPAVCKASAPRSPPRSRVCCAGTVGLRGAPLRGTTHSITVRCSHCIPLVPAQSPRGCRVPLGHSSARGGHGVTAAGDVGTAGSGAMTAPASPVITARMGPVCAKPEPRGERSIHLPAQVSVLALLQQGWMWGINSLTPPPPPPKPSSPVLGSLRR